MQDFEKLGSFYLGREYDPDRGAPRPEIVMYDSKDLLTHAVCVGMTGSGKTGLCLTLLEEAAIDGIPALVIDPKGDLSNLLLTFPDLEPRDFQPWVHAEDAQRQNLSVEDFAAKQAALWKNGLAEWGQDGARIARLRAAAEFAIYTPGSSAGLSISALRAFAAPAPAIRNDEDLLRERVNSTVTGLLALVGIDANPLESREHILLSTVVEQAWRAGHDLDLAAVIQQTQNPPLAKVGVLDLESFYPAKERFALATRLNNLLSAPAFQSWLEGEPLNVDKLLHSPTGKPRISIFSISHLDDAQRMFFVALLLNETLSWMRTQAGSTSLRAILYMDEIFGYFPPVANPPSKGPLLTLLKQARAFGVGIVLATQNPVDLDYKGLSNAGTWFLGRLQTERDKARVIEGLQGAAASAGAALDRQRIEQILSGLKNRIFLMNNVHEDQPTVFQARWAMSYLCGPLTREQIRSLMHPPQEAAAPPAAPDPSQPAAPPTAAPAGATAPSATKEPTSDKAASPVAAPGQPPLVPPDVPQFYVSLRGAAPENAPLLYEPVVLGLGTVHFTDRKLAVDLDKPVCWLARFHDTTGTIDWADSQQAQLSDDDLQKAPAVGASFAALPAAVNGKAVSGWKKSFADGIYRLAKIDLLQSPSLELVSKPDEPERDFRIRLQQVAREERDRLMEELRQKYASKLAQLDERLRRAQQAVEREKTQAREQTVQTVISFGATLLDYLLGRKRASARTVSKAQTAARGVGRTMKQSADVAQAEESVEALTARRAALEEELRSDIAALQAKTDALSEKLETVTVRPKKVGIAPRVVALAWLPHWQLATGTLKPAWE